MKLEMELDYRYCGDGGGNWYFRSFNIKNRKKFGLKFEKGFRVERSVTINDGITYQYETLNLKQKLLQKFWSTRPMLMIWTIK